MKITDIITEAPLVDYEPLGFTPGKTGGFRHQADKTLATSPVAIGKVQNFFARTPTNFRLFPVQFRGGGRHLETGPVSADQLEQILGAENARRVLTGHTADTITVVYTNNTGVDRVPLTAWILAHRIGHAIRKRNPVWDQSVKQITRSFAEILKDYYGFNRLDSESMFNTPDAYKSFFNAIGTMRSARQNTITRPYEFIYELLTQYINSGSVKFNPAPSQLLSRRRAWGRAQTLKSIDTESAAEATAALETLARDLNVYFSDILNSATGKIFVM
jgi:ubiquinone biosynthesis protein UbiJ